MTSGSNCRHLNKPQTEEANRSIRPAYHELPVKLQHCHLCRVANSISVSSPQGWARSDALPKVIGGEGAKRAVGGHLATFSGIARGEGLVGENLWALTT